MELWIVDTNVIVSGLISRDTESPTAKILSDMLYGDMIFVLSPLLLAEYRAVLVRPAISKRHGLSEPEIDQILIELTANAKGLNLWTTQNIRRRTMATHTCGHC